MPFPFRCNCCGRLFDSLPAYYADRPDAYWDVPEEKRDSDIFLTSDSCVIADRFFFIRGCIEIPIIDEENTLTFGVWVSLKEDNFLIWQNHYDTPKRDHLGPFFGWLSTRVPVYPNTINLKTNVHLQNDGVRPYVELEESNHPLAIDQHNGISLERAVEIIHKLEHQEKAL